MVTREAPKTHFLDSTSNHSKQPLCIAGACGELEGVGAEAVVAVWCAGRPRAAPAACAAGRCGIQQTYNIRWMCPSSEKGG